MLIHHLLCKKEVVFAVSRFFFLVFKFFYNVLKFILVKGLKSVSLGYIYILKQYKYILIDYINAPN